MTYTFKLSRRIARLRAPLFAALILTLTACDNPDSLGPESLQPTAEGGTPLGAVSFSGGIPMGTFAQPNSEFGSRYNGAHRNISPNLLISELSTIRSRGGKIVLMMAGSQRHYKNGDGTFSLSEWKARIDRYRGVNFSSFINDGTIIAHYLIDEPYDASNFGGKPVPGSTLEEMARYSKSIWPSLKTVVRAEPYEIKWSGTYQHLDAAWAQYLSRKGNASDYIQKNVSAAKQMGLGLIVGLNLVGGGTPNGTWMTPSEVESWGSALLSSDYPCAFISWQYNESYLSSSSMKSAMDRLRHLAQYRSSRSCGDATSGGQTPPPPTPPPPPPTEPPPTEPPPAFSGVPFGPYGGPTSEAGAFTGALRGVTPDNVLATAADARRAGMRIVLRLGGSEMTNADGTFSLTKWKAALDRYAGVDLSSYTVDGTIAGHLLVRNPQVAAAWGGRQISHTTLEEMARYSRQRWPAIATIVHAPPSWLADKSTAWQYLDAASAMYSGSAGDAGAWVAQQASEASAERLGLLVSMNVLNGGTSASQLAGTTAGNYAMSASQLRTWGSALVAPSRVCGVLMARYDAGYFGRSDIRDAVATVSSRARARAATSCRMRT